MRTLVLWWAALFTTTTVALADCNESVRKAWDSAKAYNLTLEAHAIGPACATSAVVLLVVDEKNEVQYATTRLAQQNLTFQEGVTDGKSMKVALENWLKQGLEAKPHTAKDLPVWKQGADQPEREGDGEFGFFAGKDVDRDSYQSIRDENQPLFCFVQGIESTSCIAAAGPTSIYELGGFTFPG